MSKFAATIKDEMVRLGRREAKRASTPLKARITALERLVRAQRATLKQLSRQAEQRLRAATTEASGAAAPEADATRVGPRSIRSQRKRLKLSQAEFAKLVGVTPVAVYLWESGKTRPRAKARAALVAVRAIGVKEARAKLEATQSTGGARRAGGRRRATTGRRATASRGRGAAKRRAKA